LKSYPSPFVTLRRAGATPTRRTPVRFGKPNPSRQRGGTLCAFLTLSIAIGDAVASYLGERRLGEVIREDFLIGGWVAMWRPLEVFLYD
jgi:hypothetical protein